MKRLHLFFFFSIVNFVQPIFGDLPYEQTAAYGQLLTVQSTSIAQLNFTYNVNAFFAETNLAGTGTINYENGMAVLQTTGLGSASLSSKIRAYAQPGQGYSCVFAAIYSNGDPGTTSQAGIGNDTDGFFFGLINNEFSIIYINNSITTTVPQNNWNVDSMNGTGPSGIVLNYSEGNIYKIQYQQLEFGNINFYIESPLTGQPLLVHTIQYANLNTVPSLSNPGLQLKAQVTSAGGSTELDISSMSLYTEGDVNPYLGIRNSVSSDIFVSTTLSNVLTIQDNLVFNSITNQLMVIPDQLSLFNSSTSGEDALFSVYLNPVVTGPVYMSVNPTSAVSYDTTGTLVIGGTLVGSFFLSSGSDLSVHLSDYGIQLSPGDTLVVACTSVNFTNINVYASISWIEQF